MNKKLATCAVAAVLALGMMLGTGCSSTKSGEGEAVTLETFAHAKVAVTTGSVQNDIASRTWPEASIEGYQEHADAMAAVMSHKADCAVVGRSAYEVFAADNPTAAILPESLESTQIAFAYPKGTKQDEIPSQIDAFIVELTESGELDEIYAYWTDGADGKGALDFASLPATNGTINAATCANEAPYEYVVAGGFAGTDIDIIYRFCERYGYGITLDNLPLTGIITGLGTGKYQVAACGLAITDERQESIDFSTPVMYTENVAMYDSTVYGAASGGEGADGVAATGESATQGSKFANSFYKTFVKEDRWKMIVSGLGVTLLVTLLSAIFGTALGFGIAMLRRRGNKVVNKLLEIYVRLFQGLPVLVVLLIFYYVVFGKADISAVIVATITFSLNSAAFISEELYAAIASVDPGQRQAALALGFTEGQAFLHYVLPPAIRQVLPVYRGELIGLLKGTSIVGYVALMDLTKAGDIIRSRTYEAVFPLLMIAIIYLLMAWVISQLLKWVEKRLARPRPQTKIKGVTMH